ncbi:hypothetical protein UFOVP581_12 [uncultured Caudovirales phage]|uniref:TET-Associated Glycosyltransferase domain-containing protein n=1 Tax=uncultured Caudovirales phage TaxID=2100421 RepID=A0A6J5PBP3_9CAUD|nr:hypothetical protein UFOVP581_12 [uncultured Caudovirales phage]
MIKENFAIFILTHGRADNVITYKTLRDCGYSGEIYIVIDNLDPQIDIYKNNYKEQLIIFDKEKAIQMTDSGDNQKKHNSVVYARNYNFQIAKDLGVDYFLQLDDDYSNFGYSFNGKLEYIGQPKIRNFDDVCNSYVKFLKNTPVKSIAFAQSGDFIGGAGGISKKFLTGKIPRKIMNAFFFKTNEPVVFMGRINEDVNLYVSGGIKGELFCTHPFIRLQQLDTQSNKGGLTDIYLDIGTYVKSFYSVMYAPSCVKIHTMGVTSKRIHHRVSWKNCNPMILNKKVKKC